MLDLKTSLSSNPYSPRLFLPACLVVTWRGLCLPAAPELSRVAVSSGFLSEVSGIYSSIGHDRAMTNDYFISSPEEPSFKTMKLKPGALQGLPRAAYSRDGGQAPTQRVCCLPLQSNQQTLTSDGRKAEVGGGKKGGEEGGGKEWDPEEGPGVMGILRTERMVP